MKAIRTTAPHTPSTATIVACRDMLRHARHPARLRANSIVHHIAATASLALDTCSDEALCAAVSAAINVALAALSPRQSTIVRRCDLGGERYADVSREMFISTRHAFRERDGAMIAMIEQIMATSVAQPAIVRPLGAVFDARIRHARTLEQNGHWQTAAALLEELALSTGDAVHRRVVATRLVRLYSDAERFADADRHLLSARGDDQRSAASAPWEIAELDLAAARLANATGNTNEAAELARRSTSVLRAAVDQLAEPRVREALIGTYLLRADIANGRGELAVAAGFASKARDALALAHQVDTELALEARLAAAMLQISAPDGPASGAAAERELFACYAAANDAGLTRQAIRIVTHLSLLYGMTGRPRLSVNLIMPLVSTARLIGTRSDVAAFFHEVASALLGIGEAQRAATYVADLRRSAFGHAQMEPWAEHLISRLQLAERHYADALESARNSAAGFSRIGQERYVGTALRFEAEALARMGLTLPAIEAARRSIEILASRSAPVRLAEAYRLLGELTGNTTHITQSRKLLRSAHPGNSSHPANARSRVPPAAENLS